MDKHSRDAERSFLDKELLHSRNDTVKVVVAGCVAIAIALVGMGFVSAAITRNAVVAKLKNTDLRYMARAISATIEGRIDKAVDASLMTASDPSLLKWVESGDQDEASGWVTRQRLAGLVKNFGNDTAFLVSGRSHNYWSYDGKTFRLLDVMTENDPADAWYFKVMDFGSRYQINIDYNTELKDTYVWINVLVGDISAPSAVTGVGMNLGAVIHDLIEEDSENGLKSDVWLADGSGKICLSKDDNDIGQVLGGRIEPALASDIAGARSDDYTVAEYTDSARVTYDVVYKRIRDTDWHLIVRIPRSESLGFLDSILFNTAISGILIIAIVALLFQILSRRIADPYSRAMALNAELEAVVEQRTHELADRNRNIQDSIDYALTIQRAQLPSENMLQQLLGDHVTLWMPRDTVGGDFYWVRRISGGTLFVLGDCTGHGVPGALMTMSATAMLDHIADRVPPGCPEHVLSELGRMVGQTFGNRREDGLTDGLDAAVLFVSDTGGVRFSGARIPLYVVGSNGVTEIRGARRTLDAGLKGTAPDFRSEAVVCFPGDTLYLATDGLHEQPGGERGLPMGKERLKQMLLDASRLPVAEQARHIADALAQYIGNEERRDDMTLFGVRVSAHAK